MILDCVGGTEVIPYMDELLVEDPQRPDLGVYVSISGDSTFFVFGKVSALIRSVSPGEKITLGSGIVRRSS